MSYSKDKLISAQKMQVQPRTRPAKGMLLLAPILLSFMSSQQPPLSTRSPQGILLPQSLRRGKGLCVMGYVRERHVTGICKEIIMFDPGI